MIDMLKKGVLARGLTAVSVFLLGLGIYGGELLETNKIMVDQTLGTKTSIIVSEEDDSLFKTFIPDEDFLTEDGVLNPEGWLRAHTDTAVELQREGTVLLQNKNNVLPLTQTKPKITVFGTRSGALVSKDSWAEAFDINPTVAAIYGTRASTSSPSWANNKAPYRPFDNKELSPVDLANKNADYADSFENYNDAAIVVFGRQNAEGADYKPGADAVLPANESRNSLASTKAEREIINLACDNFDKVILLVQTVSQMELGDYIDKVDAIVYIGLPDGQGSGAKAIAEILTGQVNPSGGLYDIYASHSESSPAMMNFGLIEYANKDDIALVQDQSTFGRQARVTTEKVQELIAQRNALPNGGRIDTSSIGTGGTDFGFYNYLVQAEGLYVGYRYYETRYEDCVLGQGNAAGQKGVFDSKNNTWNYSDEVDFGFGFGLSYTTFEFSMGDVTFTRNGRHEVLANFDVSVKNTGTVAGKTPIQIYSQSPYTQYDKDNGVEKSAIQLVTFEKSGVIEPGQTKTYPVVVDLQDVASYDCKTQKTYIMENSDDYYFAVGNGAHDALNNILALKGKTTANGMDYNGRGAAAKKWSYYYADAVDGVDNFTFAYSKTGVKITNQLNHVDLNEFLPGTVTELSRKNWEGTWPKTYNNITANAAMINDLNGNYLPFRDKNNSNVTEEELAAMFDQPSDLKFSDFKLSEYNDYRWDELIDHMSLEETLMYALQSGRGFAGIESIGFPQGSYSENGAGLVWRVADTEEAQAPWKVDKPDGFDAARQTIGYFNTYAIWASSFNRELIREIGRIMGNDSILGDKPIVWLPGSNTHRTPYGGRASQYFCEDPVLTGICTMELAYGALEKGGIITAKHFAFNDQEGGRSGISVFMTEQRAREIELRAFQIAFEMNKYDTPEKDVGMLGTMTAFNKIGTVECTASKGLMTNILREEWGFNGYVVTDLKDDLDIGPQIFLAGSTGYDWRTQNVDIDPYYNVEEYKYDMDLLKALKDSCRRKLWVFSNTPLVNFVNRSTRSVWNMTSWRAAYISVRSVSGVVLGISVILLVLSEFLKRKGAK